MTNVVSLPEFSVGAYRFTREPFARLQTWQTIEGKGFLQTNERKQGVHCWTAIIVIIKPLEKKAGQ